MDLKGRFRNNPENDGWTSDRKLFYALMNYPESPEGRVDTPGRFGKPSTRRINAFVNTINLGIGPRLCQGLYPGGRVCNNGA
ncbi:hypothetical protein EVAR_89734_1 [Eumeta japonica]|uniref:Uncharacterized protein n=1 Tax=Eumeta variegata TaxID=151549 RepID=A0A4C1Y770_EUMVA|nr:hypothetical protein EVAR_89734_1 [Eumeta japonica]